MVPNENAIIECGDAWTPPGFTRGFQEPSSENFSCEIEDLAKCFLFGQDYRVLAMSESHYVQNLNSLFRRILRPFVSDLPIYTNAPNSLELGDDHQAVLERHEVPGVEGAFVVTGVLTREECVRVAAMTEAMGYADPPLSIGRNVRANSNVEWTVDDTVIGPIFERCRHLLPQHVEGGDLCGVNVRWRCYRYNQNEIFRPHIDAAWPGSGISPEGDFVFDFYGDRRSQLTFLLYLNDDFEGGHTSFFLPKKEGEKEHVKVCSVKVPQGGVLCFYHGDHHLSQWHEGSLVTKGTKYVIRSEVLYTI